MKSSKIQDSEIENLKVASLPTRPTAPTAYGGAGLGAQEMKAAFDRLPLFLVKRYNQLIDDICTEGENSLAASLPTSIEDGHSLKNLFEDIKSGKFASYLSITDCSLLECIIEIKEEIKKIKKRLAGYNDNDKI